MKKIDDAVATAVANGWVLHKDNTHVQVETYDSGKRCVTNQRVFLFGNMIAEIERIDGWVKDWKITDCGWATITTSARLNGVITGLGIKGVYVAKRGERTHWFAYVDGMVKDMGAFDTLRKKDVEAL